MTCEKINQSNHKVDVIIDVRASEEFNKFQQFQATTPFSSFVSPWKVDLLPA
jgi:hypothetical protein